MSDAIDQQGCFRHRASTRYFTVYEDFQDIAKGKHADKIAAFLRILEVKTNKKIIAYQVQTEEAKQNGQPLPKLNLWLEVSYNDFASWALHLFGRSSFQVADKEAEKMLFCKSRLRRRHARPEDLQSPLVEYKEYLLVLENVQAALDGKELPIIAAKFETYDTPTNLKIPPIKNNMGHDKSFSNSPDTRVKNNTAPGEVNRYKSKEKEGITTKENISSSNALRDDNASSDFKKVSEEKTPLTEKEQQIIKWFCEVSGMTSVNMTRKAAQESMIAILPEIESIDDMRGLYEQAKNDIAARSDAKNKTVYLANLKDALFNWKQNKPVVQPTIAELPALTEQEATQKVLWTRRPSKLRQMIDVGYDSIEDHMKLLEWMPLHEAREYYYGFPGAREYTPEEIEQYEQLTSQQEPKRLRLV